MRKLAALVEHILSVTGIPGENVAAWAEGGDARPQGRELAPLWPGEGEEGATRRQIELGSFRYDGIVQIERYPGDGAAFVAIITTWLAMCDPDREGLEDPILDIELNIRGGDSDVQLSVEFVERLTAVEDPHGIIPFEGRMWSLAPVVAPPATTLAMIYGVNKGAGKCR